MIRLLNVVFSTAIYNQFFVLGMPVGAAINFTLLHLVGVREQTKNDFGPPVRCNRHCRCKHRCRIFSLLSVLGISHLADPCLLVIYVSTSSTSSRNNAIVAAGDRFWSHLGLVVGGRSAFAEHFGRWSIASWCYLCQCSD